MNYKSIRLRLDHEIQSHLRKTSRELRCPPRAIVEAALREYFWPKDKFRPEIILSAIKAAEYQGVAAGETLGRLNILLIGFLKKWFLLAGNRVRDRPVDQDDYRSFDLFLAELGFSYDDLQASKNTFSSDKRSIYE